MFDPYRKWLGIPEESLPPTHYQLLGISPDEQDLEVIEAAVLRQSAYVRNFQAGKYGEHATRLLTELANARLCLTDAAKRAAYDAELRRKAETDNPPRMTPPAGAERLAEIPASAPRRAEPAARPLQSSGAAEVPSAGPARPLPPPVDLDRLASQAGLSGRRRRAAPVRLPSRRKQQLPVYSWAIPLALGALVLMVVILVAALGRSPRRNDGEQTAATDAEAETVSSSDARSDEPYDWDVAANGHRPLVRDPAGPDGAEPDFMNSRAGSPVVAGNADSPAGDLTESESNSGSPSLFPGEADGGQSTVSIPVPARDPMIVFAPGTNPFVAVGQEIYDLQSGAPVGKTGAYQARTRTALRALSPDGAYYASADETTALGIEVRSMETGQWLFSLPIEPSFVKVNLLEFAGSDRLVSAVRYAKEQRVAIASMPDGEVLRQFVVRPFERSQAALSDDGRLLAIVFDAGQILLYDLTNEPDQRQAVPITEIHAPTVDGAQSSIDGLSFSPYGDELAAVLDGGARILCWNDRGQPTFEHSAQAGKTAGVDLHAAWTGACVYEGPAIEWHPHGRGWLFNGHFFFDRESRRVIWMLQTERDADARMRFLDADRLLTLRGDGVSRALADLPIPWRRIDRAIEALAADQPRRLGPGEAIRLDLRLGNLLPDAERTAVAGKIEDMLADRLAIEKIGLAPDGGPQLRATYYEENSSGGAQCEIKLELFVDDGAKALWKANLAAAAPGGGSADARRARLYGELEAGLHQTPMPYFIPQDPALSSLPAIIRP